MNSVQLACVGKHGYPDVNTAEKGARRATHRVVIYRCTYCKLWHIGHNPKGGNAKRYR